MTEQPANEHPPVLELRGVGKRFGTVEAVKKASIEVHQGEVLTLLGPSGCGKTTTLRMVIGLERVSSGEILYEGKVVDGGNGRSFVPPNKRNMGMVFQSYAIWPHMTVSENVAYPLNVRRVGRTETRERVARVLDQVGLTGMGDRQSTMLSGGQQQRVAVARSLVFEPNLLLLDEPFSNLDAKLREQMRVELKELQRRLGITVLFVTHDQIEALSLSDRIVVMDHGNVEQVGTPTHLYRNPQTPAVRDFLGRTVMFTGTVVDSNGVETIPVQLEEEGGPVIRARVTSGSVLRPGERCNVAVRPEVVDVSRPDGRPTGSGQELVGTIGAILFVGERYEARVRLPWGQDVQVYLPASQEWEEGQDVSLEFDGLQAQAWPVAA
ncbi:MAG: ABC transporter ATP-binding protein [Chloroflexi bacterium]|nr:ABC transporter ATP-binding protein [Chloroflexota bacterium]